MGQCATAEKETIPQSEIKAIPSSQQQNSSSPHPPSTTVNNNNNNNNNNHYNNNSSKTTNDSHSGSNGTTTDSDKEFCDTVQLVSLLIIDRLIDILDHNRDGYQKIANKLGKNNYLDIIAPHHYEKFIKDFFTVTGKEPAIIKNDPSYHAFKLKIAIQEAQNGSYRDGKANRIDVAKRLVEATKATRNELLLAVNACDQPLLRTHLQFFARAMEYAATDELIHHPSKIFEAIDDLTRE